MTLKNICILALCGGMVLCVQCTTAFSRPSSSVKFSIIRAENPNNDKETLILPFAFPSESMGTTIGVGTMAKGYGQEQLLIAGAVWGSADEAVGGVAALWDYKIPYSERFFFSMIGSAGKYPRQRAYTDVDRGNGGAGSNGSDKDNYAIDDGTDNWFEAKIEYVLPMGSMQDSGMGSYHLTDGLLESGATGGDIWNPLTSGVTSILVRQFNRYQSWDTDEGTIDGTIHPIEFALYHNNTDFPTNPTKGSTQNLSYTQDFGWGESEDEWSFLSFEASKYFDLGSSSSAKQQVLALNFWTGDSPSWKTTNNADGSVTISDDPPYLEGAKLGGFYRMKAYPMNRFNDKSVVYGTAEYRHTLAWNPTAGVSWLRFLKLDWFQVVGFVEGGRVAPEYSFSELFSDWKADAGLGLRAMVAGGVVRFDWAISEEGNGAWVMFGHPF